MKHYMEIMGKKVRDKVTGFEGAVECVSFDLYGCVQVAVKPPAKDGETKEGRWFDHKRLEVIDHTPVMDLPNYDLAKPDAVSAPKPRTGSENGPADKPAGRNP